MKLAKIANKDPSEVIAKIFNVFDIEPEADLYEKLLELTEKEPHKK